MSIGVRAAGREELTALAAEFVHTAEAGTHESVGFPSSCYGISKMLTIRYSQLLAEEVAEYVPPPPLQLDLQGDSLRACL